MYRGGTFAMTKRTIGVITNHLFIVVDLVIHY